MVPSNYSDRSAVHCSNAVMELARGIRLQLQSLVSGLAGQDLTPMSLGLSHSLSRYKLKFSPDKVSLIAWVGCTASLTVTWHFCIWYSCKLCMDVCERGQPQWH